MTSILQRKASKQERKNRLFFSLCVFTIAISFVSGTFFINASCQTTKEYGDLLLEKEELSRENATLVETISRLGSIKRLDGFFKDLVIQHAT